jgi:hypothetical protein
VASLFLDFLAAPALDLAESCFEAAWERRLQKPPAQARRSCAGEELHMKSKLMLMGAASALLVSFACGCAAEVGTDEGTSTDPKAAPAEEKVGTTESPIIFANPPGFNPPGFNPWAPGLNPPGFNPAGMGMWGVPGAGLGWGMGVPGAGLGWGVGVPGWGMGMGNLNGGWNRPGPF